MDAGDGCTTETADARLPLRTETARVILAGRLHRECRTSYDPLRTAKSAARTGTQIHTPSLQAWETASSKNQGVHGTKQTAWKIPERPTSVIEEGVPNV